MKAYAVNVRNSLSFLIVGFVAAFVIFVGVRLALAQQPPPLPPIPPPSTEELRDTADTYNNILLQQTKYWEASAKGLWKKLLDMTKERDEAVAKLKALEPAPAQPAAKGTN